MLFTNIKSRLRVCVLLPAHPGATRHAALAIPKQTKKRTLSIRVHHFTPRSLPLNFNTNQNTAPPSGDVKQNRNSNAPSRCLSSILKWAVSDRRDRAYQFVRDFKKKQIIEQAINFNE